VTARVLAAAVGVVLAALIAGAVGAIVAAAVVIGWAGRALRARYAAAPLPDLDLPEPGVPPRETVSRLERLSGQLAIAMYDGRYYDRAVRPLLRRVATAIAAATGGRPVPDDALFGPDSRRDRAPLLAELTAVVDRMERL
jgi:hypothetical protein